MIAAVRVRGVPDTSKKASQAMQSMLLHNKNNCVLLPDTGKHRGMLTAAKDYITYGEVDTDTAKALLEKRGELDGVKLADNPEAVGYESLDELVDALDAEETSVFKLRSQGLHVPFRLSPPSKGYKDSKRHYRQGGSLGERDDMNTLLQHMV